MSNVKIYLAQIDITVGDIEGNFRKIVDHYQKAQAKNCDLIIFPEMTISGYPAQDLWQKQYFIEECQEKILQLCKLSQDEKCAIIVGCPTTDKNRQQEITIRNSAILIDQGQVKKIANKKTLPNYGVFDEKRYFEPSKFLTAAEFKEFSLNIMICEDIWDNNNLYLANQDPADLTIAINSSPYSMTKKQERLEKAQNFVQQSQKPLIYLNQIGGQDSLVFDGNSFILDKNGNDILELKNFSEDFAIIEISKNHEITIIEQNNHNKISNIEKLYNLNLDCDITANNNYSAAILGLRDYVSKNNFTKVILGMSGGIDSALVATMAVDALGSDNVKLYALPSRFNSDESMVDAKKCAKNLNVELEVISIEPIFESMLATLPNSSQLTKENMQSRLRGNILMSLSNDKNALLLSTGNKSELACGYATIYGDMCGAYNPIKDLYKSQIYQLANWRNDNIVEITKYNKSNLIPQNIIDKAPTAELRENQKDSDSLPDYEILDQILFQIIEEQKSLNQIIAMGFSDELVKKTAGLFYNSEYKRKQAVIGPKISSMSFDLDRRYPITNKFTK